MHLPNEQHIVIDDTLSREEQKTETEISTSALMLYFGRPVDDIFHLLTYLNYNEQYIVKKRRHAIRAFTTETSITTTVHPVLRKVM